MVLLREGRFDVKEQRLVLVIDDEEAIREAVADILSLYDIVVLAAADGEHGTELFKENAAAIALILLDITLPGLSGEDTFDRIREIDSTIPIVISSGYRQTDHRPFPPNTPFLPKPYDLAKLTDMIWRYLPRA